MDADGVSRRQLLVAAGVLATGTAGCQSRVTDEGQSTNSTATRTTDEPTTAVTTTDEPTTQTPEETTRADGERYADVYGQVVDAVVSVRVYSSLGRPSTGSGFLLDGRHIITNEHVVSGADSVYVRYADTDWREVTVLGTDVYSDLAVMSPGTVPEETTPLSWATTTPEVGTRVVAIGNPFGLDGSVSEGIVSGVDRSLESANNFSIAAGIQTDAAVNPGNSGGPLVDLDGDVLGVINSGGGDNVGFAISAQLARRVVPELIADGSYEHSYMGVGLSNVSPTIAEANDLERASGVYINSVRQGGPSEGVLQGSTGSERVNGVEVGTGGDVVRGLDGTPTPTRQALATYLALETSPDDQMAITLQRDGETRTVDITLGTRPPP